MSGTSLKSFSKVDVSSHNKDGDMGVIIDQDEHPGGKMVLLSVAGSDTTKKFHKYHRQSILSKYKRKLLICNVQEPQQGQKSIFKSLETIMKCDGPQIDNRCLAYFSVYDIHSLRINPD